MKETDRLSRRGQTMVEMALLMPLFVMVLTGIIVFGLFLFYQQQVVNAAREAARYAAVHSATADCPTSSRKKPIAGMVPIEMQPGDQDCDPASRRWPFMTAHARDLLFGVQPTRLHIAACWSGYVDYQNASAYDSPPRSGDGTPNTWNECTIGGVLPLSDTSSLSCPAPATTAADDRASNMAYSGGATANRVTVYACYTWRPPLSGFLLIPETVTLRAAISEALQHQR